MHKVMPEKPPVALKVANFFGALGYLSLLFEWFWVFGLLLYPQLKNVNFMLPDNTPAPTPAAPPFTVDNHLALIISVIVTIFCVLLIIYALYQVPRSIAKTGSRAAHIAATNVIPAITHNRRIGKNETKRLAFNVVCTLKAVAMVLPLFACLFIPNTFELPKQIIGIVAMFFAGWVTANFVAQISIALFTKLDTEKVW